MKNKYVCKIMAITMTLCFTIVSGCGGRTENDSAKTADGAEIEAVQENDEEDAVSINPEDMFTERDISGDYDEKTVNVTLADASSNADDESVDIDRDTVKITGKGTYVITGSLSDGMVIVDAGDSDKVQLVLNGVDITSKTSAPVYVRNAKKVFITLAEGTDNTLANGGSYEAIDENNIDAVIFAKDDITFNGKGSLTINASAGHGVVGKDDVVITSGTYNVTAVSHSFDGKDSIRVAGGTFNLSTGKDGLHSENKDDPAKGYIYVKDGDFTIAAESDGMSAASLLRIDGGRINVTESYEGLEAKDIILNDGDIQIVSADDGVNATDKSTAGDKGKADPDGNGERPEPLDDRERPERPADGEVPERPADGEVPERPDGTMPPDFEPGEGFDKNNGTDSSEAGDSPDGKKMPGGSDGKKMPGGPGGGDDVQDVSVVINGGTLVIDAEGDGIDSNGSLTINGGTVYIAGPSRGGNGALDYGKEAVITGGTVIAAGDGGMAESFGEESTQESVLVNVEDQTDGGDIILKDDSGNELIRWNVAKRFNSVVVSCPQMLKGEKYTLITGNDSTEVNIE